MQRIKAPTTRKSARTRVSHNFKVWLAKLIGSKHETEVVSCQLPLPPTNCWIPDTPISKRHHKTTKNNDAFIHRSNQPQKQSLDERRVDCIVKSSFLSCIHRHSFIACSRGGGEQGGRPCQPCWFVGWMQRRFSRPLAESTTTTTKKWN